jgi:hypothetical protein
MGPLRTCIASRMGIQRSSRVARRKARRQPPHSRMQVVRDTGFRPNLTYALSCHTYTTYLI